MIHDPRLTRIDSTSIQINNPYGIDATLFASDEVPVEAEAVTELLELLELQETIERIADAAPDSFDTAPEIVRVALTPDFHKARSIPVGTVLATRGFLVPQAIGNDINCGMRLHTTSLHADQITARLDTLETTCRRLYFEGGRNIPMHRSQREALFTQGLMGLLDATPRTHTEGLWALFHELDIAGDLERIDHYGSFPAQRMVGLDDFLGPHDRISRDTQIGSIGGGNHFVEFQHVETILDKTIAHAWGLKPGMVTIMVHTGSVSIGHLCGNHYREQIKTVYPRTLKHPRNGIFILPQGERHQAHLEQFWDSMHNAANFAFANRLFLALIAMAALRETYGDIDYSLLYDAPHNMLWREQHNAEELIIHRKGACPARGYREMSTTPFAYYGEPVLVPGSMGASSFILAGQGAEPALWSASHGAGRQLARGRAMKGYEAEFEHFMERFRVVTPVDLRRPDIQQRRDIVAKKLEELKQEAPYAYKGIGPVIDTLTNAGMAKPVVELRPILTVKG